MAVNGDQIAVCNESLEVEPHLRVFTGEPLHETDERPRAIARHWIVLSIHPADVLGHGGFGLTLIECEIVKLTNNRFVLFRCVRHELSPLGRCDVACTVPAFNA